MRHRKAFNLGAAKLVNADARKHRLYQEEKRLEIHATHS